MPLTPFSFRIDPQGVAVSVRITDINDAADAVAYLEVDGTDPVTFPVTVTSGTDFYFAEDPTAPTRPPDQPVVRSDVEGLFFTVSALFGATQVASPSGAKVLLEARRASTLNLSIGIGDSPTELQYVLDGARTRVQGVPDITVIGGDAPEGAGGALTLQGGVGGTIGGQVLINGGNGTGADADGGNIFLAPGTGSGAGEDGDLNVYDAQENSMIYIESPSILKLYGGPGLAKTDRPAIATQVGTVDVAAFNDLRDALIALGLVIDGD